MLTIVLKDKSSIIYDDYEYTHFGADKKFFVVKKYDRIIGMYNIDSVSYIQDLPAEEDIGVDLDDDDIEYFNTLGSGLV